jgi:hypothetical protein
MINLKNVSRYKAASIHLALSAAIAALVIAIMLALWYPPPLFTAMGGSELLALIVGVDVAIGPLITLIIFDTRKKELVFDLAIVAALQLGALGYGMMAMHSGRPVFTVFAEHHFAVVSAAEIDDDKLAQARFEEFRHLSLTGPRLVATKPPTDPDELSNIAFLGLVGMGIQNLPKYYVPYAEGRAQVLKASLPIVELDLQPVEKERLESYLKKSGRKADELRCLPVKTKLGLLTALIDAHTGDLLDILNIKPNLAEH